MTQQIYQWRGGCYTKNTTVKTITDNDKKKIVAVYEAK